MTIEVLLLIIEMTHYWLVLLVCDSNEDQAIIINVLLLDQLNIVCDVCGIIRILLLNDNDPMTNDQLLNSYY